MKNSVKKAVKPIIQIVSMAVLICIDLLIKSVAEQRLADGKTVILIKNFIGLFYARNTGAAFSMFSSSTDMLSVFTGILIIAGIIYLIIPSKRPLMFDICLPLIIAGGTANLIDRLYRGYVVDYIMTLFVHFPIFNFADCLITCGCFALIIYLVYTMLKESKDKKNTVPTKALGADGETDD